MGSEGPKSKMCQSGCVVYIYTSLLRRARFSATPGGTLLKRCLLAIGLARRPRSSLMDQSHPPAPALLVPVTGNSGEGIDKGSCCLQNVVQILCLTFYGVQAFKDLLFECIDLMCDGNENLFIGHN